MFNKFFLFDRLSWIFGNKAFFNKVCIFCWGYYKNGYYHFYYSGMSIIFPIYFYHFYFLVYKKKNFTSDIVYWWVVKIFAIQICENSFKYWIPFFCWIFAERNVLKSFFSFSSFKDLCKFLLKFHFFPIQILKRR